MAYAFQNAAAPERINVVGPSGSGKTTFARELASLLGLPCYEMDGLFWEPGWRECENHEFLRRVEEVTSRSRWVLDGNYSTRTLAIKWKRVQLVVWLDPSPLTTFCTVTARTLRRSFTREELWPGTGNRESLTQALFSRKSIIWLAMTTHARTRRRYNALMAAPEYAHIEFVRLSSRVEAKNFLRLLRED